MDRIIKEYVLRPQKLGLDGWMKNFIYPPLSYQKLCKNYLFYLKAVLSYNLH